MSNFDPDAYLAKKGIKVPPARAPRAQPVEEPVAQPAMAEPPSARMSDADVDAYLERLAAKRDQLQVGGGETFLNRAVNALPLGRPIVDGLTAATMQGAKALGVGAPGARLTPTAAVELAMRGEAPQEVPSTIPGYWDSYRDARDTRDVRTDVGSEQNPWAGRAGTAAGIALTAFAPLPKALGGTGGSAGVQAARAAAAGGRGALAAGRAGVLPGALQAFGDSRADLTRGDGWEAVRAGADTALGGAAGFAGGALGYGLGKVLPTALRFARRKLSETAAAQAEKVLTNGTGTLQNRAELSTAAKLEAIRSGAILPWGTTKGAALRLDRTADEVGTAYSATLDELERLGVKGPEAAAIVDPLLQRAAEKELTSGAKKTIPRAFLNEARNAENLALDQGRLGLKQAEQIKRTLQEEARYGRLEETPLNGAKREIASIVRQANEDAVRAAGEAAGQGSDIGELADSFVPLKRRLGSLIEARTAAERGAAAAGRRANVGVRETMLGAATGNPAAGLGVALGASILKNRIPSTVASGSYWTSELARALAGPAAVGVARGTLPAGSARLLGAGERQALDAWLQEGPLADEETRKRGEARLRAAAQVEALRQRQ